MLSFWYWSLQTQICLAYYVRSLLSFFGLACVIEVLLLCVLFCLHPIAVGQEVPSQAPKEQMISRVPLSPPALVPLSLNKRVKANEGRSGETIWLASIVTSLLSGSCVH